MNGNSARIGAPGRVLLMACGLLISILVAPHASAQDEDRDLEFARALVDRGWVVVAERVIERGIKNSRNPGDKERYRVLQVKLILRAAQRVKPLEERAEAWKAAYAAIDELVEKNKKVNGDDPGAMALGEFLLEGAGALNDEAGKETNPKEASSIKNRALRMVDTAENIFQTLRDYARAKAAEEFSQGSAAEIDETGETRASRMEMDAAYNLARSYYQRGLLLEKVSERETAFQKAISNLEEFQATYLGTPLAYQAAILTGQCHNELKDYRRAMEVFSGVVTLVDFFKLDTGDYFVDSPVAADIIQRALYLKAQAANKVKKHADASRAVEFALKVFPGIRKLPIGFVLRIEGGRALAMQATEESKKQAIKMLRQVIDDDSQGSWGVEARTIMGEYLSEVAGDLGPIVRGFFDQREYFKALEVCRNKIAQLDASSRKEREENAPSAMLWLGKTYSAMKRYREAALVFEDVVRNYSTHTLAPEAAFEAVKARLLSRAGLPTRLDSQKYEKDLDTLLRKYKNSEQADGARFLEADALFEAGSYEKAAEVYLDVPESAGMLHDNAIFQAGLCYWNVAIRSRTVKEAKPRYEKAEETFKRCLELATGKDQGLPQARVENRVQLRVACREKLANIYSSPTMKNYDEALKVIDATDKEDRPNDVQYVLLNQSRVRSLASLGRLDEAEEALTALRQKPLSVRIVPRLCRDIARAYERKAGDAQKKGGPQGEEEYKTFISKALSYYEQWLDGSRRINVSINPKYLTAIAERALAIALEVTGLPEGKDSFTDCLGRTDLPRAEWERAVKFLEAARPKKSRDWIPLARLGRAYGFVGDWQNARNTLEEALVWGGLIRAIGQKEPKPDRAAYLKAPDLVDLFVDLGFAELLPAKKGGMGRAQAIFTSAFDLVADQRGSCAWWKCRYGLVLAEFKEGNYKEASGLLRVYSQAPEWSGDRCGLRDLFDKMQSDLEEKLPAN